MIGFDAVVWQTGYRTSDLLTAGDMAALQAYLDDDGGLFLSSMDLLITMGGGNTFTSDYLGIASWTNNTKANTASGVSGDPITDGITLPLTFPQPAANRVDTVNPGAGASAIFFSETNNPAALRHELGRGSRVVFSTIVQDAISTSAPDPNNSKTVIARVLDWLLEDQTVGVGDLSDAGSLVSIRTSPNPFRGATEIRFRLPGAGAGEVTLHLVDAAGRTVRTLVDGALPAGAHAVHWDGTDDAGRPVAGGLYFAKLRTGTREESGKVVLLR
jgi:hypothetical protein